MMTRMFGLRCCCWAAAGKTATVRATMSAKKPGQIVLLAVMLEFLPFLHLTLRLNEAGSCIGGKSIAVAANFPTYCCTIPNRQNSHTQHWTWVQLDLGHPKIDNETERGNSSLNWRDFHNGRRSKLLGRTLVWHGNCRRYRNCLRCPVCAYRAGPGSTAAATSATGASAATCSAGRAATEHPRDLRRRRRTNQHQRLCAWRWWVTRRPISTASPAKA